MTHFVSRLSFKDGFDVDADCTSLSLSLSFVPVTSACLAISSGFGRQKEGHLIPKKKEKQVKEDEDGM